MDNGIYVALSRQLALIRDMEVTANNLANVNTTGYNAEKLMFDDYLVPSGNLEKKIAFANDVSSYRDTRQGPLQVTGNPLDVAISGPGYLSVETPLGLRYTRAGNFQIDGTGTLVTPEGYKVLDDNGQPIIFNEEDQNITIGEAGNIMIDGELRGNLGVSEFANPQVLERTGSGLYKVAPGLAQPAAESRVLHGVIENSNVQPVLELTRMIQVGRSAGSTAKLIETQYDLIRKTSDAWAKAS